MRLPGPRLMGLRGAAMELFTKLFSDLLVFVYHCFDRIVIHGYLSGLSRPEQVVFFFRQVVGAPVVSKELLSQRTTDYQKKPRWAANGSIDPTAKGEVRREKGKAIGRSTTVQAYSPGEVVVVQSQNALWHH